MRAKKSGLIYVSEQYISLIRNSKKKGNPLQVNEMSFENFFDFKALFDDIASKIAKDKKGNAFKLQDVKLLQFKKRSDLFFYKTSYKELE